MVSAGALETTQLSRLTEQIEGLVVAGGAIDKIDKMVLPLPYCQLLKIFQIFFVFTLPFVLALQLGLWTPIVAAFTAIGFFGPIRLASSSRVRSASTTTLPSYRGLSYVRRPDAMVRTVSRTRMEARLPVRPDGEPPDPGRRRARPRVGRSCRKFMTRLDVPHPCLFSPIPSLSLQVSRYHKIQQSQKSLLAVCNTLGSASSRLSRRQLWHECVCWLKRYQSEISRTHSSPAHTARPPTIAVWTHCSQ